MTKRVERLAIIGIGLIGSSIARAVREVGNCGRITVIDRSPAHRAIAEKLGLGDSFSADPQAARDADLIILATPSGSFAEIARTLAPVLKPGCIVSDTGSVKQRVLADLKATLPGHVTLIPAHPLAGTEYSGPEAGDARLFHNRYCLLTPEDDVDSEACAIVRGFWSDLGALVETMHPHHHDRVLAMTSHLPHFISFAMVHAAESLNRLPEGLSEPSISHDEMAKYSAGGFRDLTRIAHADPEMWRDVLLYNREAILEMLAHFQQTLSTLAALTAQGNGAEIEGWVRQSRQVRKDVERFGQAGRLVYNEAQENPDV